MQQRIGKRIEAAMRDYGKVTPKFWTGETGRMLRQMGRDEQLLALFLITGPNASMIGLYDLPMALIVHYLKWDLQGASEALRRVSEGGFCEYDRVAEQVWIPEMAAYQLGEPLDKKDNRVKAVIKEWLSFRKSQFFLKFYQRYGKPYHLPDPSNYLPSVSPFEAPSKPLRSQEQEQEQDNTPPNPPKGGGRAVDSLDKRFDRFWKAYPNHVARADAAKAWDELNIDDALLETMLRAIEAQKKSDQWRERGMIPNPGNWLRGERWKDEGIVEPQGESRDEKLARQYREREEEEAEKERLAADPQRAQRVKDIIRQVEGSAS